MATGLESGPYTTELATSRDGTTIGYRRLGRGPSLVLLHGAACSAHSHMQLAGALVDAFTVYVPDRRGRGLSGPHGDGHGIRQEVEDLDAILTKTGACNVFGISSGGLICLQAALSVPAIRKVAVYEPPLFVDDSAAPAAILARYDAEMARGKVAAALIAGMKGAQMGPPLLNVVPSRLLEILVTLAMNREDRTGSGGYVSIRALAPTLHYDFHLAVETAGQPERFRAIRAEVLLLGGSRSPAYLKTALDALERTMPQARRVDLAGLNHAASLNTDRGGRPAVVAQHLRRFFA